MPHTKCVQAATIHDAVQLKQCMIRTTCVQAAAAKGVPESGADGMDVDSAPTLDTLFKKTNAKPAIYWLPLTEEEVCGCLSA